MRKRRKRLSRMTVFGVIVLTLVLCGTRLYKQNTLRAQGKEYASQISELKKEKKELTEKKKDLEAFKEYVKTDDYIEETAREKFGLVHKGEIIFEPENQK